MCGLLSKLFLAFVESPFKPKCQLCSHNGPCAVNRSSHSTQGMWDLAKGSPSQAAVVQLPRAYPDRWPLGPPVGPPACPAQLTPVVTGAKPRVRAEPGAGSALCLRRAWKGW